MPKTLSAIAKLLRVWSIPFLGLTGAGLDDFDGRMIAAALEGAPCLHGAGKVGSDADRSGPPLGAEVGGGRGGRRARVFEQPRRPCAAPALKALHSTTQEQAFSSRTPRPPMNNETQRHAVVSWCAATGAKHVFLAGTVPAKSLVDLTEPDSADV